MSDSSVQSSLSWLCSSFESLTTSELYEILRLRAEVFVVEQDCPYQDLDNKDQLGFHLLGREGSSLSCYARLLPPGVNYPEASIGRVVTSTSVRGSGLGRLLLRESIRQCQILWPGKDITISAQHHLEKFYQEFAFTTESEPYSEDGIPHIRMHRSGSRN